MVIQRITIPEQADVSTLSVQPKHILQFDLNLSEANFDRLDNNLTIALMRGKGCHK